MYVGPTLPSLQTYLIQLGKKKRETMQSTGARLFNAFDWPLIGIDWRRVSSVVEHSSTNPKVPGSIPGILGSWIMMRHVSCILLMEWSTTSQRLWVYRISVPYAQKDPRFLFEKRRGQPREFWSLVSTIDGSTLPQDCVEEQLC